MGDRGNVLMMDRDYGRDGSPGVFIYTHNRGSQLAEITAAILDTPMARHRWPDLPYLTRILCDGWSMVCGGYGSEIGMGVSMWMVDNEHDVLVVDVATQRIWFAKEHESRRLPPGDIPRGYPADSETFEEFVERYT